MIKPEELRIGNLVMRYSNIMEVSGIAKENVALILRQPDTKVNWCMLYEDIFSIPLTEEWLLKFGFEIKSKYSYTNYALPNGWGVSMWTDEVPIAGFEEKGVCYWGEDYVPIRYVHDLQNFYYALTKKELTL